MNAVFKPPAISWPPSDEELDDWNAHLHEMHERGDLDATIKELSVIIHHHETYHLDCLQTACYKRALAFLHELKHIKEI